MTISQISQKKQVQIEEQLLLDLCKYHLAGVRDPETEERIRRGLEDKMQRAAARQQYTARMRGEE